jgi:heme/copper-type cytochrome/quinol oxidase subunit 2
VAAIVALADPVAAGAGATVTDVRAAVLLTLFLSAGSARAEPAADTVEVVASESGFLPRVINVHKGEPVRLRLTTADREHCFAIDALRVEKRIVPGRATILELTPGKAGTYPFTCCLETGAAAEKEHGRLVVVE